MSDNYAIDSVDDGGNMMREAPAYRKELAQSLNNLFKQVEEFLVISEDDFLAIGGKLREYQSHCKKVNELAKIIIEAIGTDILSAGISKLSGLFASIGTHYENAQETIAKDGNDLNNILTKLTAIENSLAGFDKIVKTLRMLGIASKIESARLNLMDGGFFLLAETVDKMSAQIGERKKEILKKSSSLLVQLKKSLKDLSGLSAEQETQITAFKQSTETSLTMFQQKNQTCASAIGEIKGIGTKLTESLMNIVQSIQFHDITRQQLQHVQEALEELEQKLFDDTEDDLTVFSHVHDNIELQTRQLSGTLTNFNDSVYAIIESLQEVEKGTDRLFEHSSKIICNDQKKENTHHDMFERDLIFITEGLQKSLVIDQNLDESIADIVLIITDLAKQIDSIEEIGTEIELVALNARVKAAHLGIDGAALGVLAEAIQKLSFEAKTQTAETFKALITIDKLSGELRSELTSSRHQTANNLLVTTVEELNSMVASIKKVEETALLETIKLDNIVKLFKNELQTTVDNISIHASAERMLTPVIQEFDQITRELKSRYNIVSQRHSNTEHSIKKYTMMSERQIHTNYTSASSEITNRLAPPKKEDEDLDDNIELF